MLALYHFPNAICAQKVRLALAEKGLSWESRICGGAELRSPEYLALNPNGVVPTLVHDGVVLTESRIVSEYIEDAFDGPRLAPRDPRQRHRMRLWSKQIDDSLHLQIFILSFVVGMRDRFLQMPDAERASRLPGLRDPIKRQITLDLLDHGFASPFVIKALERFNRLAEDMNEALAEHSWLAGPDYSLADADFTAYADRLGELGLSWVLAGKPALEHWLTRTRARPSYQTAILDWNTAAYIETARRNALGATPQFEKLRR